MFINQVMLKENGVEMIITQFFFGYDWLRYNVPKWSFTVWLQQQQRLLTLDRLGRMGMEVPTECFLCGTTPETHSHLFTECVYALKCHQLIADWLHIPKSDIADCVKMAKKHGQSMLIRQITLAVVIAIVYWIWMARNTCRIDGYVQHPVHLVQRVKEDCRRRLLGIFQGAMKQFDSLWCHEKGFK
ncbi:uncharacterized protein LOC141632967 [Silene latifolia]|uniref:uncharacterized protein LOC141632967 n=1 Tax=Silene latifolia TaxID=37657 RepID=UPI003D77AD87